MVPKLSDVNRENAGSFRAVLFRMVPKLIEEAELTKASFRAVLFRMVPKHKQLFFLCVMLVLELCCFEWFQNVAICLAPLFAVLELCCFEWFQNL